MFQDSFRWITQIFTLESPRSYKISAIALTIIVVSTSILLINMGLPHIMTKPWDVINLLEGGWRIINGQRIFVDFSSPIGALPYLLTAFGLKMAPNSSSAITYGTILSFLILTPWAWLIGRSKLSSLNSLIFALFIGFLVIAPRCLGEDPQLTSYAMLYNRQGFALISMLFVELFIPDKEEITNQRKLLSAISSGTLLFLILLDKINYLVIALAAIILATILGSLPLRQLIIVVVIFLVNCLVGSILLNLDLLAYISNVIEILPVQSGSKRTSLLIKIFWKTLSDIYLIILLLISINSVDKTSPKIIEHRKLSVVVMFVLLSGLLIVAANTQDDDVPLFFIAGLIIVENLRREYIAQGQEIRSTLGLKYFLSIAIVIPFFVGNILFNDVKSVAYSLAWNKVKLPSVSQSQKFDSKNLSDFIVPENASFENFWYSMKTNEYPRKVNEGLKLLKKYLSSNTRIFFMGGYNPFPFALGLNYPTDVPLWWDYNNFNQNHFPAPEKVFKNVDIVMIPKITDPSLFNPNNSSVRMKEIYGDYLKTYFIEKENTPLWILMTKR